MHTRMCCQCECACACVRIRMCICTCMCMHYVHAHAHVCLRICVRACARAYACARVCMFDLQREYDSKGASMQRVHQHINAPLHFQWRCREGGVITLDYLHVERLARMCKLNRSSRSCIITFRACVQKKEKKTNKKKTAKNKEKKNKRS